VYLQRERHGGATGSVEGRDLNLVAGLTMRKRKQADGFHRAACGRIQGMQQVEETHQAILEQWAPLGRAAQIPIVFGECIWMSTGVPRLFLDEGIFQMASC